MNFKKPYKFFMILFVGSFINACIEPIDLETENFESILVIEATLTNELKHHEIFLSRSYPLEGNAPPAESNADVRIVDASQNEYIFREAEPGRYVSAVEFKAEPNVEYQLKITTSNGNNYTSEPVFLIPGSNIDDLYAVRTDFEGLDGVALLIDNVNPQDASEYYRYEYEETYKIISPYRKFKDFAVVNGNVVEVPKTREEYICYNTEKSNNIILANTNSLSENTLDHFLVRFIDSDNPILSNRYSILVKQYAISREVYNYYETLEELSGSESIFSAKQPGLIPGNIHSVDNPDEKVIGVFSAASVTSKRIFFNYTDFYTIDRSRPTFVSYCPVTHYPTLETLIEMIENNSVRFFAGFPAPKQVVPRACVDCTVFGSNKVPEFWEE